MPTLKISKNWLLGITSLEFEAHSNFNPGSLSSLIDGCLRRLTPSVLPRNEKGELNDFKGRNPQDLLLPGIAAPRTDELFRVGGSIAVEKTASDFAWEPFEAVCYSPFPRFEGAHHIVFNTDTERSGPLPSWLPTRLLGAAAPIRPTFFRYGLEHFSSRLTFASLGYAPQVTESLLIDSVTDTLVIRMNCEVKRGGPRDPFSAIPAYRELTSIVEEATGNNPLKDYGTELQRAQ